jgi:putative flippase GtrA
MTHGSILNRLAAATDNELFRYFVSGVCAFAADFTMLFICTSFLEIHYLISNVMGYTAGLLVSYWLNALWVFDYRRYRVSYEFTLFTLIVLAGLVLSELMMFVMVSGSGLNYLLAKVFASGFVFFFNYVAKKSLLFSPATKSPLREAQGVGLE